MNVVVDDNLNMILTEGEEYLSIDSCELESIEGNNLKTFGNIWSTIASNVLDKNLCPLYLYKQTFTHFPCCVVTSH